jgi:hypothetical protein
LEVKVRNSARVCILLFLAVAQLAHPVEREAPVFSQVGTLVCFALNSPIHSGGSLHSDLMTFLILSDGSSDSYGLLGGKSFQQGGQGGPAGSYSSAGGKHFLPILFVSRGMK